MAETLTPLCIADDATFWPWRTWTDFARMSEADRRSTAVIVPLVGMADWGLGHSYDLEEVILMPLLREALLRSGTTLQHLMIPPLRFVLGPDAGCVFSVEPPVAQAALRETVASIASAGFRRVIFVNASPWNEELCAAASRDLRIEFGLQIFRINLSGLDLDLHPVRSKSRRAVQTLATALRGVEPDVLPSEKVAPSGWGDERVGPLPGPALTLPAAQTEGATLFENTVQRLVNLLTEIAARPPLVNDGALKTMTPP